MKRILITTTEHVENAAITSYLGVVEARHMLDYPSAIWSSPDYADVCKEILSKHLERQYESLLDKLSEKAVTMGANCIVGLVVNNLKRIDPEFYKTLEYEGDVYHNMAISSFYPLEISAYGTAVVTDPEISVNEGLQRPTPEENVSYLDLKEELTKRRILNDLGCVFRPNPDYVFEKEFIKRHPSDFIEPLIDYVYEYGIIADKDHCMGDVFYVLKNANRGALIERAYKEILDDTIIVHNPNHFNRYDIFKNNSGINSGVSQMLIHKLLLFDAKSILNLLEKAIQDREKLTSLFKKFKKENPRSYYDSDLVRVLSCDLAHTIISILDAYQPEYSLEDIQNMQKIVLGLDRLSCLYKDESQKIKAFKDMVEALSQMTCSLSL